MNQATARFRALLILVVMILGVAALSGCKKKEETATTTSTSGATFQVGDKVDVKWNGKFWKGEILAIKGSKFRVHYTGWSATWDEDVTADRLRAPAGDANVGTEAPVAAAAATPAVAAAAADTAAPFKVGDKVDVTWNGQLWQGKIIGVTGGLFRVHYIGWASSWDENVTAARLRAPVAGTKRGSGAD